MGTAGGAYLPSVKPHLLLAAVRGTWILCDTWAKQQIYCGGIPVCACMNFSKENTFGQIPISLLICCKNSLLRFRLCVLSCSFQSYG